MAIPPEIRPRVEETALECMETVPTAVLVLEYPTLVYWAKLIMFTLQWDTQVLPVTQVLLEYLGYHHLVSRLEYTGIRNKRNGMGRLEF